MSRCFPFPPPGYERKARTDDEAVLQKEKQKEKKHKKDKKDKEKSEKDRSDGKHREKKDKKEKSRDKKKDKEKDTDKVKDKPGTSEGTGLPRKVENHVTEKLMHKDYSDKRDTSQVGGYQAEKFGQNSQLRAENKKSVSVEVAKKSKDETRGIRNGGYQAEKFGPNSLLPAESRKPVSPEVAWKSKNQARGSQFGVYQSETLGQESHLPAEKRNSVSLEVARKTKDEARGIRNQLAEKITSSDHKKDEGMFRFLANRTRTLAEVKETQKDKKVDTRKPDVHEIRVAPRVGGSTIVQNSGRPVEVPGGMVQAKVQGPSKPLENNVERKADGKERTKEKEGDDKRREKRKDKDREKKTEGKDKDRDKEKKKEDKAKKKIFSKTAEPDKKKLKEDEANERNGSKHAEPDKSGETNIEFPINSQNSRPSLPPTDINKNTDNEGNLKKRKDLITNGFLHVDETRPSKLLRPSSSSHSSMQNGRTLEPRQTSIPNASDMQEGANSVKVDNKVHKKNGFIEARSSSVSPAKPSSKAAKPDPFAEVAMRPPHPDSKFLSEVYTVPKMNELADDDQDWLFGCCDTKSKKPKCDTKSKKPKVQSSPEETAQVWSEALHIESADVCALPYVIPY